ncbi:hypothetical protein GGR21_002881 [Dysgonomonas hofstadii]|uniref:Uncharacterized protein n=1 Tax=Dysgonomonas hofstadii TaxID=637886 RepID=A0A840CLM9_9BACT|nr:hypothetical protein [Dysgonomonas hofstadii]MBB4036967.1 hypothetical protein [Dysgonomonas hofstadii]
MLRIEFNEQNISVPDSWADITLADYEKWFMHQSGERVQDVNLIAGICKIDAAMLMESPRQLYDTISGAVQFVFDTGFEPSTKVNIKGQDYFITLSDKITLGEWIDIENVLQSDSDTKISEILAIVCRPAGESYNVETTKERKELFRSLSCDMALPLLAFFLHRKKESEAILNHYSQVVAQANRFLEDTKTFVINGGGIKQLPIWQRIRFTCLTRSLEKQLSKFSDFSSIG